MFVPSGKENHTGPPAGPDGPPPRAGTERHSPGQLAGHRGQVGDREEAQADQVAGAGVAGLVRFAGETTMTSPGLTGQRPAGVVNSPAPETMSMTSGHPSCRCGPRAGPEPSSAGMVTRRTVTP